MLRRSWQWQLVLIMMLVTGLALGSFILVAWQSVRISNYKKLDAELLSDALKHGIPLLAQFRREGPGFPPPPPDVEAPLPPETSATAFGFYDLKRGIKQGGGNWPDELDPGIIAGEVVDYYRRSGIEIVARTQQPAHRDPERAPGTLRPAGAPPPMRPGPRLENPVYLNISSQGREWRLLGHSDGNHVVMALRNLDVVREEMSDLARAITVALPITLLVIGLIAWYLAGRAVSPVRRLTRSASSITAEDLSNRLAPLREPREFAELIDVYNRMLDRLEGSFLQARRFSADAAHELNTPITVLKGHLDAMLQAAEEGSETQQQIVPLLEETQRLQEIIQKLLLLSQADAGQLRIDAKEINLSEMVQDLVEDLRLMASGIEVVAEVADRLMISGDQALLRQCIFNLLSNAIKYNHSDGFIRLVLREAGEGVQLDVTNSGNQIPNGQASRLFDRFYRADLSRNAQVEGRGLGLALSREFAKAHRGSLDLVHNEQDRITFRLELPRLHG